MGRSAHLRAALVPLLAAVLALAAAVSAGAAVAPPAPLAARLDAALRVPGVDLARTAALAVDLETGEIAYSRNAELPLLPASNEKLAIAYTALTRLGPGYRFRTEVLGLGSLDGAVWRGDLVLKGYGDPTLDRDDLLALARDVRAWGIHRVSGAVFGDESTYDALRTGPGWKAAYYIEECAPLSALIVDRSRYQERVSHDPARTAGRLFREALESVGVTVGKHARRLLVAPSTAVPLALDVSEPLADIVRVMGRDSDNFMAEMLLKQLGERLGTAGTTGAGARVVRQALIDAAVPLDGVRIADGSGLSRLDRLTATSIVSILLAGEDDGTIRDAFLGSLAVAGVDGTLKHRLEKRPARSRVIAKTGTTNKASALAGFVRDRWAFAVVQNGSPVSAERSRRAQDRFATVLAKAT
jgi:D-alanyl-D-alanine carboxypeptidase/D-alanyl-D-alanine-endopeptidase (penicillin-binding protein 4)